MLNMSAAAPPPDELADVYRWMLSMTSSVSAAEDMTVEVCRRLCSSQPGWLSSRSAEVKRRFYTAQLILEQRGTLHRRIR